MKELEILLQDLDYKELEGQVAGSVTSLVYDSRKLEAGCIFICLKGANFDGHDFIEEAIENRAACIVVEKDPEVLNPKGSIIVQVEDTRKALALISAAYFDYPAREVGVIGVTGTKGKTTTAYLVRQILQDGGLPCGLMGTIETIIGDEHIHALNTTPESYIIQESLRKMADAGEKYCVMEVSSQGLMLHRTYGIPFEIGIFTNISPDHIGPNEHDSFEEYLHCKSLLFSQCKTGIINKDDEKAGEIIKNATCKTKFFSMERDADYRGSNVEFVHEPGALGTIFKVSGAVDMTAEVMLPGYFSAYNALSAIAMANELGVSKESIVTSLKKARVRGRIELVETPGDYTLIIDYAHNALSLESILKTLRAYEPGRLVSIFGCGGNRDPERRFQMGEVSGRLSDLTIITSDNPRFEEPLAIMENIKTGIERTSGEYVMVEDRKEAIRYAIQNARPKDVILLAGKGHEDYQEIKGERFPMDERDLVSQVLSECSTQTS